MTTLCAIRSILWIGPGEGLARVGAADVPSLDITWVRDADEALSIPATEFDAAVLDGEEAESLLTALGRIKRGPRASPVIVCLPEKETDRVRDLLAAGAAQVLLRAREDIEEEREPGLLVEFLDALDRIFGERPWHPSNSAAHRTPAPLLPGMVGRSRALRAVVALVEKARDSMATVLLAGETGTGKEVIARALHSTGPRRSHPFLALNCAAFPDTLLESELFGYVKGAFTGAERTRAGLFEAAHRGTLSLDESAETSAPLQAKNPL
jgi:DNA-binding NtrC family response regulator